LSAALFRRAGEAPRGAARHHRMVRRAGAQCAELGAAPGARRLVRRPLVAPARPQDTAHDRRQGAAARGHQPRGPAHHAPLRRGGLAPPDIRSRELRSARHGRGRLSDPGRNRAGRGRAMKRACTVLISSAGRRVELIQCFRDGAAALDLDLTVIAVDLNPAMSAACQKADRAIRVPPCDRPEFIDALLEICVHDHVDLIVPTIDPELEPLSTHAHRFREIGAEVAVSTPAVVRLARDKLRTAEFLSDRGLPAPRTGLPQEVLRDPESWPWPVMIKPRAGSSSIGIRVASSQDQLAEIANSPEYLVQELLRGEEYTVNL